ncbi:hypothetical protein SO802_001132 [Lithocarpus litseifolius]|uniref:RNase H type-1 domain-containing protein n=1 Tax=Lithocarpus litseifolius TaxID=425828 RepID=A0AAW2DWW5_9ROSI
MEEALFSERRGGMGFRDLRAFNLALLAKQGWRIQQNPNSLVHRVFKARYFVDRPFEEVKLGRRPSYARHSILATRKLWFQGQGGLLEMVNKLIFGRIGGYPLRIPSWEIVIEGDAQVVIKALQEPETCPWPIQKVVEGVELSLSYFKAWTTSHVNRKGNEATHLMAKMAKSLSDCKIWVEDTPPIIADQVLKDVTNLYPVLV